MGEGSHNRNQIQTQGTPNLLPNLSFTEGTTSQQKSPHLLNIVARKRPPPLNVGFNELGIDQFRQVLYRNFHHID